MPSDEPLEDRCAAKCRSGGYCENYPVEGSSRCRMHGGTSGGAREGSGAPEGNGNAITHGVTADPFNLYDNLDDTAAVEWIDALVESYAELLELSEDDPRMQNVYRACINMYQANRGDMEILQEGMTESQTIGVTDDGAPVVRDDEHHLNGAVLSRDREARQMLRTLGAFDDPESQKADAMRDMEFEINIQRVTEDNVDEFDA